ncbi:MAG: phosphonopyruvate decarboxylase [Pseudomonadota bacterium]|nr:phosphonopyruvate decarboxylase [Pseudomonadota bacterium]
MIEASSFIEAAKLSGFGLFCGVPCSYLKPFINYVIDSPELRYVGAANEGDAVAIAAGANLAGVRSVAMFQNSGLGNAVNPLTSLTHTFEIPLLLIPTLRGEPSGSIDEPQHELMGSITLEMLDLMQIPWEYFPINDSEIDGSLTRSQNAMNNGHSYALVMRKDSVAPVELKSTPFKRKLNSFNSKLAAPAATRNEMIRAIQSLTQESTGAIVIASTGYTGRELYACEDRANQFYMVGSMGCAISVGLGVAISQPARKVVVLDGDGAALMRLGAQTTVGYENVKNLVHVLLDNAIHESTGGQATVSHSVNFCSIASACGYEQVFSFSNPDEVAKTVANSDSKTFIHAPILPGIPDNLPRPKLKPAQVSSRFSDFLTQ